MRIFLRQIRPAVVVLALFTVICGLVYPLAVTAVGQVAFRSRSNGSVLEVKGQPVGSSLIGQVFVDPKYFHSRPSSAGNGYDGMASSGSNLGPNNPTLLSTIADRVSAYRTENNLSVGVEVPVDAVTASASGLDPQISIANALLQAPRVAAARGISVAAVLAAVTAHTQNRPLGFLGDPGVAVLPLNIALDQVG